jgi:hypothetical protein
MHDDPPLDPARLLGREYYELALELLTLPASVDALDLHRLSTLIATAPNAPQSAARRQLSLPELQARLDRLSTGERVALLFAAERRSAS